MIALTLLLAVAGAKVSAPAPEPFVSREFWATVDWKHPEAVPGLKGLPIFEEYDPAKHRVHDARVLRRGEVKVGAEVVEASILEKDEGTFAFPRGIRLEWAGAAGSAEKCYAVLASLEAKLGPAAVKVDPSRDGEVIAIVAPRAQWDVGPTRVSFGCIVFEFKKAAPNDSKSMGAIYLHAWHNTTEPQDRKPTWVRCTRKLEFARLSGERVSEDLPDLVLGLDEKGRNVLSQKGESLTSAKFEAATISYTIEDEEKTSSDSVVIDRRIGTYEETRKRPGVGGRPPGTATIRGTCTKFDGESVKF